MQNFFEKMKGVVTSTVTSIADGVKNTTRKILNTRYGFQLRAKIMPYSTCFSHSVSNLLSSVKIDIAPDAVTARVNSPEYTEWAKKNVWGASANVGKLQIFWGTQQRLVDEELKKAGADSVYKSYFNQGTTTNFIMQQLKDGFPVVIDTYPVYYKTGTRLGHIVAIVGFEYGFRPTPEAFGSTALFTEWVKRFGIDPVDVYYLDDPFGAMWMNYVGNENLPTPIEGDDTPIPMALFNKGIRGCNSLTLQKK